MNDKTRNEQNRTGKDNVAKFPENRTRKTVPSKIFELMGSGSFDSKNTEPRTDLEKRMYGKRRALVAATAASVALGLTGIAESNKNAEERVQTIEACVSDLKGSPAHLVVDVETGIIQRPAHAEEWINKCVAEYRQDQREDKGETEEG